MKKSILIATVMLAGVFTLTLSTPVSAVVQCAGGGTAPTAEGCPGGVDNGGFSEVNSGGAQCEVQDSSGFFGFPTWYKYLDGQTVAGDCNPVFIQTDGSTDVGKTVAAIGMAVFEIILRLAGILAVFFVIYGGVQYVISQGEPDKTAGARNTIINALVGAVIVAFAVPIVNLIGGTLAGQVGGGGLPQAATDDNTIRRVLSIIYGVSGAVAVIIVVIGGFRYVISQGEPQKTSQAKNTIIYALVGLAVIIFAQVITSFVFGEFN